MQGRKKNIQNYTTTLEKQRFRHMNFVSMSHTNSSQTDIESRQYSTNAVDYTNMQADVSGTMQTAFGAWPGCRLRDLVQPSERRTDHI